MLPHSQVILVLPCLGVSFWHMDTHAPVFLPCMEHNLYKHGEITIFIILTCWENFITFSIRTKKSLHCIIEFQWSWGLHHKAENFLILHTPRKLVFEQSYFLQKLIWIRITRQVHFVNNTNILCLSYLFDILEMITVESSSPIAFSYKFTGDTSSLKLL